MSTRKWIHPELNSKPISNCWLYCHCHVSDPSSPRDMIYSIQLVKETPEELSAGSCLCPPGTETTKGPSHAAPTLTWSMFPTYYSNGEKQPFLLNTTLHPQRSNLKPTHTCRGTQLLCWYTRLMDETLSLENIWIIKWFKSSKFVKIQQVKHASGFYFIEFENSGNRSWTLE